MGGVRWGLAPCRWCIPRPSGAACRSASSIIIIIFTFPFIIRFQASPRATLRPSPFTRPLPRLPSPSLTLPCFIPDKRKGNCHPSPSASSQADLAKTAYPQPLPRNQSQLLGFRGREGESWYRHEAGWQLESCSIIIRGKKGGTMAVREMCGKEEARCGP